MKCKHLFLPSGHSELLIAVYLWVCHSLEDFIKENDKVKMNTWDPKSSTSKDIIQAHLFTQ